MIYTYTIFHYVYRHVLVLVVNQCQVSSSLWLACKFNFGVKANSFNVNARVWTCSFNILFNKLVGKPIYERIHLKWKLFFYDLTWIYKEWHQQSRWFLDYFILIHFWTDSETMLFSSEFIQEMIDLESISNQIRSLNRYVNITLR